MVLLVGVLPMAAASDSETVLICTDDDPKTNPIYNRIMKIDLNKKTLSTELIGKKRKKILEYKITSVSADRITAALIHDRRPRLEMNRITGTCVETIDVAQSELTERELSTKRNPDGNYVAIPIRQGTCKPAKLVF